MPPVPSLAYQLNAYVFVVAGRDAVMPFLIVCRDTGLISVNLTNCKCVQEQTINACMWFQV